MGKPKYFILILSGLILTAFFSCKEDGDIPDATELNYNFSSGKAGWTTGFAYYTAADSAKNALAVINDTVRLNNGPPTLRFSGLNPNRNLVTYLKRQFTGLQPEKRYEISIGLTFFTNAPDTIRTTYRKTRYALTPQLFPQYAPPRADTSQGRLVNIIASISTAEPTETRTTAIKQLSNYSPAVIGNTVNGNGDSIKTFKSISRRRSFSATTDANGSLWILVGTASRYQYRDLNLTEVPWRYYLQSMNVRLQPF